MNITPGYDKAAAYDGSNEKLPAGGYVCRIMKAWVETTQSGTELFALALDISEGEYAGFFGKQFSSRKTNNPNAVWPCIYKTLTLNREGQTNPFFKGMLKCIEDSNTGYAWNWQEASLQNKTIGMIFREEEFVAPDGSIKTSVKPAFPRNTQRIRIGVDVPEIKRVNRNNASNNPIQNAAAKDSDFTPYDEKLPWEL